MKKIISIALCAILLCAAVIPMTAYASGMILFEDNFDFANIQNWMIEESHFECIDGHLEGYHDSVVHQSQYDEENGGTRLWGNNIAFKVDAWAYDDDSTDGNNFLAIWWADYIGETTDSDGRLIYMVRYQYNTSQFVLNVTCEGEAAEQYYNEEGERSWDIAAVDVPANKMDLSKPDVFSMGMRIRDGVIDCFYNDQLLISHPAERGAACGTEGKSPLLLWNIGCYCGFDNFITSTADYNLFNEVPGADTTLPVVTEPGEPVTQAPDTTAIVEKVETVINDDGEVETRIVTEIVTNAPAPVTQKAPTGGNTSGGAQTGDMAVIVIAVMVAALGAAVVVKKVNE